MSFGPVALFGSGETSKHGRQVHAELFGRLSAAPRIVIIETPAGFQSNVAVVSGKLRAFFERSLLAFHPEVAIVAARRRGGVYDPDSAAICAPLERADYIFAGPGSPSYAVKHLVGTRTLDRIVARWAAGATLSLASAAAIACGRFALPVYEIYKVGDDLHWLPGLDLLSRIGLELTVLPHWNNAEGGSELDTSCCFMGADRFRYLRRLLPAATAILAIDEHTACILDPATETVRVLGAGRARILRDEREEVVASGGTFTFERLR